MTRAVRPILIVSITCAMAIVAMYFTPTCEPGDRGVFIGSVFKLKGCGR